MLSDYSFKPINQRGAALLAVLVVALVMVILMGVASNLLQGRLDLAQNSKNALYNKALVYTKRSELIYQLATQRHTVAGISTGQLISETSDEQALFSFAPIGDEIRTDGFVYNEESGLTFSIQNTAGLIPINSSSQYWLTHWLKNHGYRHSEQMRFADSLADYLDPDNTRRPAGAEKGIYAKNESNKADPNEFSLNELPRNFLIQRCTELWQVVNWQALLIRFPTFIEQCGLNRAGSLNLNAVPLSLWNSLWPNSVEKIGVYRAQNKWFMSSQDIIAIEPSLLSVPEEYYTYLGNQTFKVKVELNHSNEILVFERGESKQLPILIKR